VADAKEGTATVWHYIDYFMGSALPNAPEIQLAHKQPLRELAAWPDSMLDDPRLLTFDNFLSNEMEEPDMFLFCTSQHGSKATMETFEGYDSCYEIVDVDSFYTFLTEAINKHHAATYLGAHPIIYGPRLMEFWDRDTAHRPALFKDLPFLPEQEIRAMWRPESCSPLNPFFVQDSRLASCCRKISVL
jgi:hypothetical protein